METRTERSHEGVRTTRAILLLLGLAGLAPVGVSAQGIPELKTAWTVPVREASDSTPAIAPDGTIYFGTFLGRFFSISAGGTRNWVFQAGREIRSSPAIGADGTIYFGSRDHKLYALVPKGDLKWTFATGGWIDASPAIARDGTIYSGSWDQKFYALRPDGTRKWEFATMGVIDSSAAIQTDGTVLFGSHDGKLYALTPRGDKAWVFNTGGAIISSPALDQSGGVYFTSLDGWFYSLDGQGKLRWKLKTGGISESSPVLGADGVIYVGVNNYLWAITPEGKKKWDLLAVYGDDHAIEATPMALADNSVIMISGYGMLQAVDPQKQVKWKNYVYGHWHSSPVMGVDGTIYTIAQVPDVGSEFRAYEAHVPMATTVWPKFRADSANTGRPFATAGK
jgi:outer membrane protein assembly factor BamB